METAARETIPALLGGQVDLIGSSTTAGAAYIHSGEMRALGISGEQRAPNLPEVPTFAETGLEQMPNPWWGYAVPVGTPPDVIEKLRVAISEAAKDPSYRAKLAETGSVSLTTASRADFEKFVDQEFQRWASVIRPLNLHLN